MKSFLTYIKLSVLFLLMLAGTQIFAQAQQGGQSQRDKIEALRIAFISQQLNLSPAEAQRFWPVYNGYRNESEALQASYGPGAQLTADQQLELEQKKLDLKRKYKPQFEAALGTQKLNELYNLERKFQEKLK